jgi:hypothetical protein
VILNLEEVTDEALRVRTYYERIKVLQEKGKELATVEIPYLESSFKITDIKARTIHTDGTVIPLVGKPDDLLIVKEKNKEGDRFQLGRKVFNLPSVEVGSILEYRFEFRYDESRDKFGQRMIYFSPPIWEVQRPYFIRKAHFVFKPLTVRFIWWAALPPGVTLKADTMGLCSLDLTDIPPIPQEEWMPPSDSFRYRVLFYYRWAGSGTDFWTSEAKEWSKKVDHFAEPSGTIREAVAGLTTPSDSALDKAKKLYNAVQALDNTDFSRVKSEAERKDEKLKDIHNADEVWKQKSGTGREITLLYLAMLRAANLSAYEMRVVNRDHGVFEPTYLDFGQLQDDIVILSTGGKDIVLDPGEKMCPFQTVNWKHSGARGVRQSDDDRAAASSPFLPYSANTVQRVADVTLDGHGAATGRFSFVMTGQEALHWRQAALQSDEVEVKKQFDNNLSEMLPDGIEAHIDHFLGLDDPDVNLVAVGNMRGSLGSATSKRIFIPAFLFETRSHHPFVDQAQRQVAVDMHYAEQVTDQVVYHLPANLTLEGAPQDAKIPWEGHAVLVVRFASQSGQVAVTRTLARAFTSAKAEEYPVLRDFYQKVAAADQQQLVLTASPEMKGN